MFDKESSMHERIDTLDWWLCNLSYHACGFRTFLPSRYSNYNNEIDNEDWIEYKYSLNSFYFFNHQLISFNLRSNAYYFYDPNITIGNNISIINNIFPNSYSEKGILNGLGFIIIDIAMEDETISDSFIVINYNQYSNLITSIHIGSK